METAERGQVHASGTVGTGDAGRAVPGLAAVLSRSFPERL